MQLDPRTCYRALSTRDNRFDGRFFTGVITTGVFCRPICPARTPKSRNCEYFACAAAAQEAGYRPCLRCRPELSPGSPPWGGTSATVQRALHLIEAGALDNNDVGDLAERLGIGDRHLRRLFVQHLGTSPLAIAQTRRVLFAKQLIADTALPMSRIALLAGFTNVRRFNDAVSKVYKQPPRELRRAAKLAATKRTSVVELHLAYRPPFAWEAILAFLRKRAVTGLELVTQESWSRAIEIEGVPGVVQVRRSKKRDHLQVRIDLPKSTGIWQTVRRLRRMFDLDADPHQIDAHLRKHTRLRPLVRRVPGMRIPGCWEPFELIVRAILGQQVSVQAATTLASRLVGHWGKQLPETHEGLQRVFPLPATLARVDLTRIGLPGGRAHALRDVARAVQQGKLQLDDVTNTQDIRRQLHSIKGVGEWTVEYVALRALNDPDAFPASDLGLRHALGTGNRPASAVEVLHEFEDWRPWRAYAAIHLWKELADAD